MFGIFGRKEPDRLKALAEGFNSEIMTLRSFSEDDARKLLAAVGLLLKEIERQPLFGDVRQLSASAAEKFVAATRAEVRSTMKKQPLRGHALALIGMYVEAGLIQHPLALDVRLELNDILKEGERCATELALTRRVSSLTA